MADDKQSSENAEIDPKLKIDEKYKVFVSYKKKEAKPGTDEDAPDIALEIFDKLASYGFDVFLDRKRLNAGVDWAQSIYSNIHTSDVLIVLLEEETAKSEWVQREVDVARGAHVSILPLPIIDVEEGTEIRSQLLEGTISKLALAGIQYFQQFKGEEEQYLTLRNDIIRLSKKTRQKQKAWQNDLRSLRHLERASNNKSHKTYTIKDNDKNLLPVEIHMATGNLLKFSDIDVLVNSENDYMQMARVFENDRVSSLLRYAGAHIVAGRLLEDTVQDELEAHVHNTPAYKGLPVMMGQVIPTSAGHELSKLVLENKARYIFHVASIHVDRMAGGDMLRAIESDDGIAEAVTNTLEMIRLVNRRKGDINAPLVDEKGVETDPKTLDKNYKPIESIIFPLFGTGHGRRSIAVVVRPMIKAIKAFLLKNADQDDLIVTKGNKIEGLKRIHISVFSKPHIEIVDKVICDILKDDSDDDDTSALPEPKSPPKSPKSAKSSGATASRSRKKRQSKKDDKTT